MKKRKLKSGDWIKYTGEDSNGVTCENAWHKIITVNRNHLIAIFWDELVHLDHNKNLTVLPFTKNITIMGNFNPRKSV